MPLDEALVLVGLLQVNIPHFSDEFFRVTFVVDGYYAGVKVTGRLDQN